MKSKLILSLLALSLLPAQLCAIPVALNTFRASNGHRITIIQNLAVPCDNGNPKRSMQHEEECRNELLAHIRSKKNVHVLAKDPYLDTTISVTQFINQTENTTPAYLTGMVVSARNNGIEANSIEFINFMVNDTGIINLAIKQCDRIKDTIPAAFKNDFQTIVPSLSKLKKKASRYALKDVGPDNIFNGYKAMVINNDYEEKAEKYNAYAIELSNLVSKILNYTALSHIANDAVRGKETYICVPVNSSLHGYLETLGYKNIFSFDFIAHQIPTYLKENNYTSVQNWIKKAKKHIDDYPPSLKNDLRNLKSPITEKAGNEILKKYLLYQIMYECVMNVSCVKMTPSTARLFVNPDTFKAADQAT